MKGTILENAGRAQILRAPFVHAVIDDALDPALFDTLKACRPTMAGQNGVSGLDGQVPAKGNVRIPISAKLFRDLEFYPTRWREFATRHIKADIYFAIRALFGDLWPENQPKLVEGQSRFGLLGADDFENHDVLCDARLELISPGGVSGSHRRAHLDAPNRLFSALLYFRNDDDDTKGGGLDLFAWKNGPVPKAKSAFELGDDTVRRVVTVPYKANRLVIFPNCINALHGAEPRDASIHERAYMFITAEMQNDWF